MQTGTKVRTPSRAGAIVTEAALLFMALWPTGLGLFWLKFGIGTPQFFLAIVVQSLLFAIAALFSARISTRPLFAGWQLACMAVLAAVYIYGVAFPAVDQRYALYRAVQDFFILIGALGFAIMLRGGDERLIYRVMWHLIAGMALYVIFIAVFMPALLVAVDGNGSLAFLPFVNVRRFTNVLAPVAVLTLGLLVFSDAGRGRLRYLLWSLWILFATVLFWTGGRAPILSITLSIIVIGAFRGNLARASLFRKAVSGGLAGLVLSNFLPRLSGSFGFSERLVAPFSEPYTLVQASSSRVWLWQHTVELIAEKPWFGYGLHQWTLHSDRFKLAGSTHNFPLQVLHDFGLVGGLAAMALIFGTLCGHFLRIRSASNLHSLVALMLTVMIIQSFFDAVLFSVWSLQLALFVLAMAHSTLHLASERRLET